MHFFKNGLDRKKNAENCQGGRKEKGMRDGRREGRKERKYGEGEGDWDGGRR